MYRMWECATNMSANDNDNVCPKCGHSGEKHILVMWEYFKCHELLDGAGHICDCKIEWKQKHGTS